MSERGGSRVARYWLAQEATRNPWRPRYASEVQAVYDEQARVIGNSNGNEELRAEIPVSEIRTEENAPVEAAAD